MKKKKTIQKKKYDDENYITNCLRPKPNMYKQKQTKTYAFKINIPSSNKL